MFFNLLTATTLLAVSVAATVPPDCISGRVYTVQGDDTCDKIAQNQNVSSYQLDFINGLMDGCKSLSPGENLCLARKGQDCMALHTVVQGDNCSRLAPEGNVKLLIANNGNLGKDCQFVRIGEVLCVADYEIPYTPNP